MATIKQYREAIATAVDGITELRASPVIEAQVNAPVAHVYLKRAAYDEDMHLSSTSGSYTLFFGIRVYMALVSTRTAQDDLDAFAEPTGASSIKAVIETNAALDALCSYVVVHDEGELESVTNTVGLIEYLTKEWVAEVAV